MVDRPINQFYECLIYFCLKDSISRNFVDVFCLFALHFKAAFISRSNKEIPYSKNHTLIQSFVHMHSSDRLFALMKENFHFCVKKSMYKNCKHVYRKKIITFSVNSHTKIPPVTCVFQWIYSNQLNVFIRLISGD